MAQNVFCLPVPVLDNLWKYAFHFTYRRHGAKSSSGNPTVYC